LIWQALDRGAGLRIGITGPTWVAIDNVAGKLPEIAARHDWTDYISIARLASRAPVPGGMDERLRDLLVLPDTPEYHFLSERLNDVTQVAIVGGTADQLSRLDGNGLQSLFDILIIDEASQMDVAHSIVAFTKLAANASVVAVGDDRQMPPIHPIEPPEGAAHLVGSIYDFYARYREGEQEVQRIQPIMLDRSFRSNSEIVEFVRLAGYGDALQSINPDLRIRFSHRPSQTRPAAWPQNLIWTSDLDAIVAPDEPLTCIIHPDIYSSQRNDAEAELVASIVFDLHHRGLLNLEDGNRTLYDGRQFFTHGVGIVTPHRAQQAAVLDRLEQVLPQTIDRRSLYGAVDTVERFQGQEKAIMIASFGLGDVDQIALEEEFLYSLNRFNVITSRAKAKLVVILSRRLVDHLPRDRRALEESRLLKHYADGFLRRARPIMIPGFDGPCESKFR
jgi:superfamily I DNA and/or RNA helicase